MVSICITLSNNVAGEYFPSQLEGNSVTRCLPRLTFLMKFVGGWGETGVLVYRTAISLGAENQVGDWRILCPTNGCTVSIFSSSVFLRGREVEPNLGLAYSRKAELHPNPHSFLLIVI